MLYELHTKDIVFYIQGGSCALDDAGSIPSSALLEDLLERCTKIFSIMVRLVYLARHVQICRRRDQSSSHQHFIVEIWESLFTPHKLGKLV